MPGLTFQASRRPGEPGSETWKDRNNAWQTGSGAMWVTGSYDVDNNQVLWGTGNPAPIFNPYHRPGNKMRNQTMLFVFGL